MNQAIINDISRFSADAVYKEHMYESANNNEAEIWASAFNLRIENLVRRIFLVTIDERNWNTQTNIIASPSMEVPSTTQQHEIQESVPSTNHAVSNHPSQGATSDASRGNSTETKTSVLRQEISGLPKSIEEVIEFWKNVDRKNGFKQVRLYEDPRVRAMLIPQYVFATSWKAAGNKRKLERIQFLAQQVAKCNDNINDLTQLGSNVDWNRAIRIFKEKWSVDDSTRMTLLIKTIKGSRN